MCIGTPLRVVAIEGVVGHCEEEEGGPTVTVDLSLLPEARRGDWILAFLGAARKRLDPDEAALVREALRGVALAMRGEFDAASFADLTDREPTLPPHLAAAYAAGRTEA